MLTRCWVTCIMSTIELFLVTNPAHSFVSDCAYYGPGVMLSSFHTFPSRLGYRPDHLDPHPLCVCYCLPFLFPKNLLLLIPITSKFALILLPQMPLTRESTDFTCREVVSRNAKGQSQARGEFSAAWQILTTSSCLSRASSSRVSLIPTMTFIVRVLVLQAISLGFLEVQTFKITWLYVRSDLIVARKGRSFWGNSCHWNL